MNWSEKSAEWNGMEWDGSHSYSDYQAHLLRDEIDYLSRAQAKLNQFEEKEAKRILDLIGPDDLKSEEQLAIEVLGEGYFA